ncbi:serine hydrolase domain-containing protein [Kineococcus indalonis]|uniref:serine hydrolase domain-containing protein n=1 Tax=Kineococcus indalonis TaxID=2696566 RepID=UPI001411E8B2|nr:serine hydrolase domain-containing protein [Kineococcus indalonis]NAZ84655.1 serine hydrolase [Kineococcus indalonis]
MAALLAATAPACAAAQDPGGAGSASRERAALSTRLLESVIPAQEPGCSAAVGVDGEVVWAGARGMADVAEGRTLGVSTTFDIASVSKTFTATAVLLLAHDGSVSLQDPVSRWVPGLPAWGDDVTLDHLLHHTSGIPEYVSKFDVAGRKYGDHIPQREVLDAIADMASASPSPGRYFEYSDSDYILLAEVVRAASGQPLARFAAARIFQPLGLGTSIDPLGASPDDTSASAARGYLRDSAGDAEPWRAGGSRWEMVGAGAVQSTPSDLVRWGDNYRTGAVGGGELLDAQLCGAAAVDDGTGDSYGAGIFVLADGRLGHPGAWAGFTTLFEVSADKHTTIAVACNRDAPGDTAREDLLEGLRQQWAPSPDSSSS